jgi:hypothetical protein
MLKILIHLFRPFPLAVGASSHIGEHGRIAWIFFFFEQMVASHGWAATVHLGLPTFASLVAWAA